MLVKRIVLRREIFNPTNNSASLLLRLGVTVCVHGERPLSIDFAAHRSKFCIESEILNF